MSHNERKDFILPCGYTVGYSWGALRKAWLAFKISLGHGDAEGMKEYAKVIRKLQLQMGITLTDFESSILDKATILRIDMEAKLLERIMEEKAQDEGRIAAEHFTRERSCDYDILLTESKKEIMPNNLPPPDEKMFAGRDYNVKSNKAETEAIVTGHVYHEDRSEKYKPELHDLTPDSKPSQVGMNKRKSCYYKASPNYPNTPN